MSKMSVIDASFFMLETPARPMHVSPLIVLDPPPGFRGNFADKLYKRLLSCPVGEPFNHTAHLPKSGIFGRWKKQEDVSVAEHLFRVTAPDDQSINEYVCELYEGLLDMSKPLWQFFIISKKGDRRVYLLGKIHHALFDGVGLVNLFSRTFSTDPHDTDLIAPWEKRTHSKPKPAPTSLAVSGANLISEAVIRGPALMKSSIDAWGMYLEHYLNKLGMKGIARGMSNPFHLTSGYFKVVPEKGRAFSHCSLSLPRMKALARQHGVSVNDVFMTVVDAGVSRLLAEKKVKMDRPLIAEMMMATKGSTGGANNFSPVHIPLGRPRSTVLKRLLEIHGQTSALKAKVKDFDTDTMLMYSMPLILGPVILEKLKARDLPVLADVFVSNPYGLTQQGYMMGARVESTLPVSAVVAGHVMNITGISNVDHFHIGVVALKSAIPNLDRLTKFMDESFNELCLLTPFEDSVAATPSHPAKKTVAPARRAAPNKTKAPKTKRTGN